MFGGEFSRIFIVVLILFYFLEKLDLVRRFRKSLDCFYIFVGFFVWGIGVKVLVLRGKFRDLWVLGDFSRVFLVRNGIFYFKNIEWKMLFLFLTFLV